MGTTQHNFDNLLSHFNGKKFNADGTQIQAICPAHDDKKASMSITLSGDKALLFCHAGCDIDDILKGAGVTFADLFLSDNKPTNIYQYRDGKGNFVYEKVKRRLPDGSKTFYQRTITGGQIVDSIKDLPRVPFNYPTVRQQLKNGGLIIYVEGEKDAKTARVLGYTGTTMGGASDWKPEYANFFKNGNIILVPDKDKAGLGITEKMITDLKTVVKSLKVIILPNGKDLTEWVEAGNSDFGTLIKQAKVEYGEPQGIPEPTLMKTISGFELVWPGLNLKVNIDHIVNDTDAEIAISENDKNLYVSGFKLLSISHKIELARALSKIKKIDWDKIINQITSLVLTEIRKGEDVIWLTSDYGITPPEYLLTPLFIKNSPNIIYADQSSAKSLLMTAVDIVLTLPDLGEPLNLYTSKHHNVLYLDWENNEYITGWNSQCLFRGMNNDPDNENLPIAYLHCSLPLYKMVSHIQDKIKETNSDVVIIDSLGASVGADLNATEPAFQFFTTLRQLPVTPLIIAHTSKDINNKRKTIYGNAYYSNEARVTWEISKQQEPGTPELTVTLFNRKPAPFTAISNPIAFRFSFDGNRTSIEKTEPIQDKQSLNDDSKPEPMDVVAELLETTSKHLTPKEIATKTGLNESTVRSAVKRLKDNAATGIKHFEDGYGYEVQNGLL